MTRSPVVIQESHTWPTRRNSQAASCSRDPTATGRSRSRGRAGQPRHSHAGGGHRPRARDCPQRGRRRTADQRSRRAHPRQRHHPARQRITKEGHQVGVRPARGGEQPAGRGSRDPAASVAHWPPSAAGLSFSAPGQPLGAPVAPTPPAHPHRADREAAGRTVPPPYTPGRTHRRPGHPQGSGARRANQSRRVRTETGDQLGNRCCHPTLRTRANRILR